MSLWWLSFCDADRPAGTQFLGACLVEGDSMAGALHEAHRRACNPGGEVCGFQVPEDRVGFIEPGWCQRLLSRAECDALEREVAARLPS